MYNGNNTNQILVLADDLELGGNLLAAADKFDCRLDFRHSLMELGSFAALGLYEVVVVDYDLKSMRGDEVAQYIEAFFKHIPVILLALDPNSVLPHNQFPKCVRAILTKNSSALRILEECQEHRNAKSVISAGSEQIPFRIDALQ